ncbi:MAG: hypothetical protein M0022_08765 [Desulfobacteraceae bacterium]|nr:hypothetical protein [Desulfobacteraceae bacterium]
MKRIGLWLAEPWDKNDTWLRVPVLKAGDRPVFGGVEETRGATPVKKGNVRLAVFSRKMYLLNEEFPKTGREILRLQITERMRQSGLLRDGASGFSYCMRPTAERDGRTLYSIICMPQEEIDPFIMMGLGQGVRTVSISPAPAAISGLMGVLTPEPVLAACFFQDILLIIVGQGGAPLYMQFVPFDTNGRLEEPMLAHTFEIVLQAVRRIHHVDVKTITAIGPNAGVCPEMVGGYRLWLPEWSAFFDMDDPSLAARYPALFGSYFVDRAFDFVPASWRLSWRIQDISRWMAMAAMAGAVVLFGVGAYIKNENMPLEAYVTARGRAITVQRGRLQKMLPDGQEKEAVERLAGLWSRYRSQPRLDSMLLAVSRSLPDGVSISSLEADRHVQNTHPAPAAGGPMAQNNGGPSGQQPQAMGSEGTGASSRPIPEELLDRPFDLSLELVTTGGYAQSRQRLEEAAAALCRRFIMRDVKLDYDEKSGQGRLSCRLSVKDGRS